MANSKGVLPLKVSCVLLTVAALRINWGGVICARVVWSRFLEAASTSAERNFLNNRTPISARFGQGVCGPVVLKSWKHSRARCMLCTNSKGVLPLRETCVFFTFAALHINWAGVICESSFVQIFGDCIHECRKKLLEQSDTQHSSIWPRSMRSCRKSLHIVHSMECLHVMRMIENHVCTNQRRINLESAHPLMKFGDDFRWTGTLTWICC